MLTLNPLLLMLLSTQLNTSPDIQNVNYTDTNTILNQPVLTQPSNSNKIKTDIAQTFSGDCDKIRYVSDNLYLGLSSDEIEYLGSGYSIRLDQERLSDIHQILMQYGGESSNTSARGEEGVFWFIRDPYALLPNSSSLAQVAQRSKSVGKWDKNQKLSSSKPVDFLTQSDPGGRVGFGYNFRGKQCIVYINLREFKITY